MTHLCNNSEQCFPVAGGNALSKAGCVFVVNLFLFECESMPSCSCAYFSVRAVLLISPVCVSENGACALQSTTACALCPFQSTFTENQSI